MAKQGLVQLWRTSDMVWDTVPAAQGSIRITRIVTARESPTLGGGICTLEGGAELAWTPNYDEIVTVLEGELTILHDGESLRGGPGEVFLIRYGADMVYRAVDRATFAFALYPATWKNIRWPE